MSLIVTVPPGLEQNVGVFSLGDIPGVIDPVFPHTASIAGFAYVNSPLLHSLSLPNLTRIDRDNLQQGSIFMTGNVNLRTFSAPLLQRVGGDLVVLSDSTQFTTAGFPSLFFVGGDLAVGGAHFVYDSNLAPLLTSVGEIDFSGGGIFTLAALTNVGGGTGHGTINSAGNFTGTAINLPNLVTVASNIFLNCPNLVSLDLSSWVPTPGTLFSSFGSDSLNLASVNLVLRRCVLNAAFGSGSSVTLTGAAPSGQGATDKATLIGRGVSVITS